MDEETQHLREGGLNKMVVDILKDYENTKDTEILQNQLKQIYLENHDEGRTQIMFECIKNATEDSAMEYFIDLTWSWEMEQHNDNKFQTLKYIKENIKDPELVVWIFGNINREGIGYKINKIIFKSKKFMGTKLVLFLSISAKYYSVFYKCFFYYLDLFKDVIFACILKHISNKILVRPHCICAKVSSMTNKYF